MYIILLQNTVVRHFHTLAGFQSLSAFSTSQRADTSRHRRPGTCRTPTATGLGHWAPSLGEVYVTDGGDPRRPTFPRRSMGLPCLHWAGLEGQWGRQSYGSPMVYGFGTVRAMRLGTGGPLDENRNWLFFGEDREETEVKEATTGPG